MNKFQIESLYFQPLMDLVEQARRLHKKRFKPHIVQASQLFSILRQNAGLKF